MTTSSLQLSAGKTGDSAGQVERSPWRFGLAGKIAGWAILFGTAIVVTISFYAYRSSAGVVLEREAVALNTALDQTASRLDFLLETARQDVTFLSRVPPIDGIIRAETAGGVDILGASGEADAKDRLAEMFTALMEVRPEYFQVRFIGVADGGREIVRVDRHDASILRTPEADLQAKGDRPYFQATIALPEGSLYLSKIELNQELGRIEIPHRPTVRIATPVDGPGGVPFGIVIVNADAGSMLSGSGRHLGDGRRLFITNAEGDYLVHPDEAMTFGFDLGHSHRLQGDHPELAGLFTADGDPSFTGLVTTPAGQDLASARRVHIDPADPTRYLVLAALTDDAPLLAGIAARGRSIAVVAIALIVGGTFVAILLTGMITRPLHQVTRAAASLAAGNRDVDLSDLSRRADETGDLARAFTEMARQIVNRENELIEKAEELQHSNTELAQFAYVASHDLQEPLRMVGSYLTLLRQRHAGKLDAEADEFIGYAVDGAARMKLLINDLLNYSRVSNRPMNVEAVDTDAVVTGVIDTLAVRIEETGAEVIHESLPTVHGDAIQLERLFARLIENAMKYRSEAPPRIRVAAEPQGECWLFSVADNGIGIDPRFRDKVFDIFKRLHGREQYPGTGIGLAVCKMVVERHGGKIWVEPAAGGGSVFKFTLPAIVERKGVA